MTSAPDPQPRTSAVTIVMGTIALPPGRGLAAAALIEGHLPLVRSEEGCEMYLLAVEPGAHDTIQVAERWASSEALASHMASGHQRDFVAALRGLDPTAIRIDAWDASGRRALVQR